MPKLELIGVGKRFAGGRAGLEGVSLEVRSGELMAVLGPSGSGKTTLLRLLAGLEAPTEGRVLLDGRDASALPARFRDAAIIFQNQAPYPHLDVRGNLAFSARAAGHPESMIAARIEEAAEVLGLAGDLDREPSKLSGEKQRLALGRVLVRRPSLLLLDEPFSSLMRHFAGGMRDLVRDTHRRLGSTTVLVTHDPAEALALADRAAVLEDGRLVRIGSPGDILG